MYSEHFHTAVPGVVTLKRHSFAHRGELTAPLESEATR
jgi:hypothetical protein